MPACLKAYKTQQKSAQERLPQYMVSISSFPLSIQNIITNTTKAGVHLHEKTIRFHRRGKRSPVRN